VEIGLFRHKQSAKFPGLSGEFFPGLSGEFVLKEINYGSEDLQTGLPHYFIMPCKNSLSRKAEKTTGISPLKD